MPQSLGATELCQAAANGDVKTLKLLIECAGVKVSTNIINSDSQLIIISWLRVDEFR